MKIRSIRNFGIVVLSIFSLACAFATGLVTTPTPAPSATSAPAFTATATIKPTVTITPTPNYTVDLADSQVKFPAGGFAVARINGYEADIQTASLFLSSEDGKVRVYIVAFKDSSSTGVKSMVKNTAKNIKGDFDEFNAAEPVVETRNGMEQASVDFDGVQDDEPVHGRITFIAPPDSKVVYFYVIAAGDQRWEREGQQAYDALAANLVYFPIQAIDTCPANSNSGYGGALDQPIRIGGGLRDGEQRIHNYLDALLGPHGELIAYYREGTEEYKGVNLETYHINFGTTWKTLYFDIYSSAEIRAPLGLKCSAPLPRTLP